MNADSSSRELVEYSYRLLKQYTYYDKVDMFLRANIATYETSENFSIRQDTLIELVDHLREKNLRPSAQDRIKDWLRKIDYRLLPKSVELPNNALGNTAQKNGTFVSNVRTSNKYILKGGRVQYFFLRPCRTLHTEYDLVHYCRS